MGTFLNPGKNAFEEAVRSEIYVDKTDMILHLNAVVGTKQKYRNGNYVFLNDIST